MPEKIEIIYAFNGYADPKIKDVEFLRVNGYRTKITKEGKEKMVYQLKNITEADVKRIIECADQKGIDIDKIIESINKLKGVKTEMTDQNNDEKRFSEEEKKVEKYLEDHKGENLTYRDAVLACLDRSEPKPKKVFTEEEIKKRENLKAVENYLDANPRATYSEACKVLFKGEKPTLEEKLIEEYMGKNPGSDYKTAVIESLSLLPVIKKRE